MAMNPFYCWKCGEKLLDEPLPLARLAECPRCRSQLHVCRMCEFFDRSVADSCKEPVADRVMDKERANFCGYLRVSSREWVPQDDSGASQARQDLEALFGGQPDSAPAATGSDELDELNSLFGKKSGQD